MSLIIVGGSGGTNVGTSFLKAAQKLNLLPRLFDTSLAYNAPYLQKKINWYLQGRYPTHLTSFSQLILQTCYESRPRWLLATGIAPVSSSVLRKICQLGIECINFLTDDPWNREHYAPWFLESLLHYDCIFSPRRSNLDDLYKLGCSKVAYLPFGYDEELFYPDDDTVCVKDSTVPDIVFAGAGDADRLPYMSALVDSGLSLDLYGIHWGRFSETRSLTHGQADVPTLRRVLSQAKLSLCLVRRANRDGHCMRTFEVPAVGACMLTEDTCEHREIFGSDGEAVVYFSSIEEMVSKAQHLLGDEAQRQRLAKSAHSLIVDGNNTYGDRLKAMLGLE